MEEDLHAPAPSAAHGRLWLAVAVALVAGAVWAGVALAASRSSSNKPTSSPATALMKTGYVASSSAKGDCPDMGHGGSSSGSSPTPGV
jgi:hypothetical protein